MSEQPKTLADLLGVENPQEPDYHPAAVEAHATAKTYAIEILNSPEYRASLMRRIVIDELPSAVECKLWDYAYGRPVERVQVQDLTPQIDDETMDQLKSRVEYLFRLTHTQRMNEVPTSLSDDEDDVEDPSIH